MTEDARLTHLDERGQARMVDVSGKDVTVREARARGRVLLSAVAVLVMTPPVELLSSSAWVTVWCAV